MTGIYVNECLTKIKGKYSFIWKGTNENNFNVLTAPILPVGIEWINKNSVTQRSKKNYTIYVFKNMNYEKIYIVVCGITSVWIRFDNLQEASKYISKVKGSKLLSFDD